MFEGLIKSELEKFLTDEKIDSIAKEIAAKLAETLKAVRNELLKEDTK